MTASTTILIKNATILTEAGAPLVKESFLKIAGPLIEEIGPMDAMPAPGVATTVIDASRLLVMPGLINGHTHCPMTLFRGLADDLELSAWLGDHIFPAEAEHVNSEMVYWCSKLAAAEMLLSGTTSTADGYFLSEGVASALSEAGLRAVVAHGVIDFPAPGVPDPGQNIAVTRNFVTAWSGRSPLITPAVFAHSPYTCSPDTLKAAKRLARDSGVRFFIHLAESSRETAMLNDPRGTSPVRHLEALDLLDSDTVCVHSVWLDDRDLDILAATGVQVVTCPQSNLKLASGIARIGEMLSRGITVGLGTDGSASNNSLDMFREMDMLAKVQKLREQKATALPARQALACATSACAAVLGLEHTGRLAKGFSADLILVDLATPHLTPFYNPDLLVYAARGGDVQSVIVGGRVVVLNRRIVSFDLEEVLAKVEKMAVELQKPAKITTS